MKKQIIILMLFGIIAIFAQDSLTTKEDLIQLKKALNENNIHLQKAGNNFRNALIIPAIGDLLSVILYLTKPDKGNDPKIWYSLPAIIGNIVGIIMYLSGAGNLKDAGKELK